MFSKKIFQIKGLRNGISYVLRRTFSVNKYEGKCNKLVVLFTSLVLSVRYNIYGKKVKH